MCFVLLIEFKSRNISQFDRIYGTTKEYSQKMSESVSFNNIKLFEDRYKNF